MMYKKIVLSKIADHQGQEKTPTHVLKVETENAKGITVASLWTRNSQYGPFLSGTMKDEYVSEKATYPAYCIVEENYIKKLVQKIKDLELSIPKTGMDKVIDDAYKTDFIPPTF